LVKLAAVGPRPVLTAASRPIRRMLAVTGLDLRAGGQALGAARLRFLVGHVVTVRVARRLMAVPDGSSR
jgi:hypothetical protein